MPVKPPTAEQLSEIAARLGLQLSADECAQYADIAASRLPFATRLEELAGLAPAQPQCRPPARRPDPEEDPLGAWYWRAEIRCTDTGPLADRTLAVKDNICIAGMPMMAGSSLLDGFVPETDAAVVTRALDAGATIIGTRRCARACASRARATPPPPARSATHGTRGAAPEARRRDRPRSLRRGPRTSPSAVTRAGASGFRHPGAGSTGLKPTWGLVPYTGAFPLELTLDHLGPMASTTADVASLLAVIAGYDGLDPRQARPATLRDYSAALTGHLQGLRVGVVSEGFGWSGLSDPAVDAAVRYAITRLARLAPR